MRKLPSILFALVLAVSLVLVPAVVSADDYDSILTLENKDGSWAPITGDGIQGTLDFNSSGAEFEYKLTAAGLAVSTDYSLIYYADKENRFQYWGGDNPGALIVAGTSDTSGNLNIEGSTELNMSLPCPPDANIIINDYSGSPDNYGNAHGAKIWLIPSSAITPGSGCWGKVTAWPFDNSWLFETNLIYYTDTDFVTVTATICVCDEIVGCSVSPNTIDFGYVTPGQCNRPVVPPVAIVVTNTSTSTANPPGCKTCTATNIDASASVSGYYLRLGLEYGGSAGACDGSLVHGWSQANVAGTTTMSNIEYDVHASASGDIGGTVTITCVAH